MWIFTKYGFFSVVCARQGSGDHGRPVDPDRMMVRARTAAHLENLKARFPDQLGGLETFTAGNTDYACRIFVDKSVWTGVLAALAEETDYDNFKSAVKYHLGPEGAEYHDGLNDVWGVMRQLQR